MADKYENHEIERCYSMKEDINKKDSTSSVPIYAALSDVRREEESAYTTVNQTTMCAPVESNNEVIISNNNDKTNKTKGVSHAVILVMILVLVNTMLAVSLSIWSVFAYIQINSLKVQAENINDKEVQLSYNTTKYIISETNKSQEKGNTCDDMNENNKTLNLTTLANLIHYNASNYVYTIIQNIGQLEDYPAASCEIIYFFHSYLLPGYFWVRSGRSQINQVYCKIVFLDYYRYNYLYKIPVWMRVAELNKTNNGAECFPGLQQYSLNRSSCVVPSYSATCSQTFFSTFSIPYSRVYGIVRAYGILSPDGFTSSSSSINDNYVDGISFTYGMPPNRHHIYTLATSRSSYCYRNRPSFVSYDNYDCLYIYATNTSYCSRRYSCSKYIHVELEGQTTQDIEMRVCRDQSRNDEDIIIEDIELYVQ